MMAIPGSPPDPDLLARDIGSRINEELPQILRRLLESGQLDWTSAQLHFECSLLSSNCGTGDKTRAFKIASVELGTVIGTSSGLQTPAADLEGPPGPAGTNVIASSARTFRPRLPASSTSDDETRPAKRRATGGLRIGSADQQSDVNNTITRRLESDARVFPQRKKRSPDNPNLQPSTLEKFIGGVWESIFSGVKLDPNEVIEQWQAIESSGQPKLLMDAESEIAGRDASVVQGMFGRMNVLARKISQTSRTCRSLEVIVQTRWVQAFDDRVIELSSSMTKEKAKKTAISEACGDFNWAEKELSMSMTVR